MFKVSFYDETLQAISDSGHVATDVTFIGNRNGSEGMYWDSFVNCSQFLYDPGYGTAEIDTSLIVQFSDGSWLERREYDGSEWWEYVTPLSQYKVSASASVLIKRVPDEDYTYTGRYMLFRV